MQLGSKEHIDVMAAFEGMYKHKLEREPKELWVKGYVYCDGEKNILFDMFRKGYALAKCTYRQ
jgi:hypothetical protein